MSEKTQRRRVVKALRSLDAVSVENAVYPGTPDVNFCEGWIELKWLRRWPAKDSTVVSLDHFTPQQRQWLRRRWDRGGRAWLLLQVGKEWLLFDGHTACDTVGHVTRRELKFHAAQYWPSGLDDKELKKCMTSLHPGRDRIAGRRPVLSVDF